MTRTVQGQLMWQWPLTLLHSTLWGRDPTIHQGAVITRVTRPLVMGNKVMMQNNEPWFSKLWQSIPWSNNASNNETSILFYSSAISILYSRNYRKQRQQTLLQRYWFDLKIISLGHHQYNHRNSSHNPLGCHGKFRHHKGGRGLLVHVDQLINICVFPSKDRHAELSIAYRGAAVCEQPLKSVCPSGRRWHCYLTKHWICLLLLWGNAD